MFFEPIALYRGLKQDVPVEPYSIPFGRAIVRQQGTDVTVVTFGPPTHEAMAAASQLAAAESGADRPVSVEVIDLRTLYPWDTETVLDSVAKTGRLVVAHEDHLSGGIGAEIVATVTEQAAYHLDWCLGCQHRGLESRWPFNTSLGSVCLVGSTRSEVGGGSLCVCQNRLATRCTSGVHSDT